MALDLTKIRALNQQAKQSLGTAVQSVTPTPAPAPVATPQPIPVPKQTMMGNIGGAIKNTGQKVLAALQVPSQKVEDFFTGGKGYEASIDQSNQQRSNIAKQGGVLGTLAKIPQINDFVPTSAKALTSRVLLDPLNLVPLLKPAQMLGKASKAVGITEKIAPAVNKVRELVSPVIKNARNLPEKVQYGMDMIPRRATQKAQDFIDSYAPKVTKLSTPEREAASRLLEPKVSARAGIDLGETVKDLGKSFKKNVRPFLHESRQMGKRQIYDLVQRGELTGAKAKELLANKSYLHHVDEQPKNFLQRVFREGVRSAQGYLKKQHRTSGYSLDAPYNVAKREVKQIFDNEKLDFLKSVTQDPEVAVKITNGMKTPKGFVKLPETELIGRGTLRGYAIREDVASAIRGIDTQSETSIETALRGFHKLWKPSVTAWNPAFHAQNMIGNLHNSIVGGIRNPERIKQIIVGGFDNAEKAILKRSGVLNSGQVQESLMESGVMDLSKIKDKSLFTRMWTSHWNPVKRYLDAMGSIGNSVENNARGAFYLDQRGKFLAQGMKEAEAEIKAFQTTNKFLFDYLTGLTPAERRIRNFFPFYTWSRMNIPLQVEQLAKQPGLYSIPGKISRTVEPEKGGVPDERGYSFPTGLKSDPGKEVRYTPNLPSNNLFDVGNPGKTAVSMLTPVVKAGVPLAGNLMGQPWGEIGYGAEPGKPIIQPGLPKSEQLFDFRDFLARQFRPTREIQSSAKLPFPTGILKLLLGGFSQVDPEQTKLNTIFKDKSLRSIKENRVRQLLKQGEAGRADTVLRSME